VYYDNGIGGSLSFLTSTNRLTKTLQNLTNGVTYQFAILGTNILGDGPLGTTTNLLIATVPN